MKKLLLLCLLIALSYQLSKGRLRGKKQYYSEDHRSAGQFKKLKYCKIHRCITGQEMKNEMARNAKDGGDDAPAFKKKQQKCFYECQMEYCAEKHTHGHDCKHDADGQEYKPIFDEKDPQFRDYSPTEQELDEYLAVNKDPIVQKFKDKHYPKKQ